MIKEYECKIIKMSLLPYVNQISSACFWNGSCSHLLPYTQIIILLRSSMLARP